MEPEDAIGVNTMFVLESFLFKRTTCHQSQSTESAAAIVNGNPFCKCVTDLARKESLVVPRSQALHEYLGYIQSIAL